MSNYYENHLGTSFGFSTSGTAAQRICLGLYTNAHSYRDFGLLPKEKPVIDPPKVQVSSIAVPGRDGDIDTTEALDGLVHFGNCKGTFRFTAIDGRQTWDEIYWKLKNRLHGRRKRVVLDEAPDGYYDGRLSVSDKPEYDSETGKAIFTVTGDFQPYKLGFTSTIESWLWDPFSFEHGVIRDYSSITIRNGSGNVTIIGSTMPVVPDIKVVSGSLTVDWDGNPDDPIALATGSNIDKLYNLILLEGEKTLQFTGSGEIQIEYRTGDL